MKNALYVASAAVAVTNAQMVKLAPPSKMDNIIATWVHNEWLLQPLEIRKLTGSWKKVTREYNDQELIPEIAAEVVQTVSGSSLQKGDIVMIKQLLMHNEAYVCQLYSGTSERPSSSVIDRYAGIHGCVGNIRVSLPLLKVPTDTDISMMVDGNLVPGKTWYAQLKKRAFATLLRQHEGVQKLLPRLNTTSGPKTLNAFDDMDGVDIASVFLNAFVDRAGKIGMEDVWRVFEFSHDTPCHIEWRWDKHEDVREFQLKGKTPPARFFECSVSASSIVAETVGSNLNRTFASGQSQLDVGVPHPRVDYLWTRYVNIEKEWPEDDKVYIHPGSPEVRNDFWTEQWTARWQQDNDRLLNDMRHLFTGDGDRLDRYLTEAKSGGHFAPNPRLCEDDLMYRPDNMARNVGILIRKGVWGTDCHTYGPVVHFNF